MSKKATAEDKDFQEKLGRCLREIRQERRLHQKEVADAAGVTRPMVSAYERGRVMVTLPVLLRVLGAMNATLTTLDRYMHRRELLDDALEDSSSQPTDALGEMTLSVGRFLRSLETTEKPRNRRQLAASIRKGFRSLEGELKKFLAQAEEDS